MSQVFSQDKFDPFTLEQTRKRQRTAGEFRLPHYVRRMPAAARGRFQTGRKRKRSSIPASGVKRSRGRTLVRKTYVPRAPAVMAHRKFFPNQAPVPWTLIPQGPLVPSIVIVPENVWAIYNRGFDVGDVTSAAIHSRNVTCNFQLEMPVAAKAPQPYQMRFLQGFIKAPVVGKEMSSTQGNSGMSDGICLNFDPNTVYQDHAYQTVSDFVGTTNGDFNPNGAVDRTQIHVVSDRTAVINLEAVDPTGGSTFFPAKNFTFNWKTNKHMRLYPYSTDGQIPAVPSLTPVNNPGLWIPFLCVMIKNNTMYTDQADAPKHAASWAHYWDQL